MAILDPVSPFLALIDHLISLVRERKTRRRDYFEKIIDPLYTQFTPLGEDYLKLFRFATGALERPKRARKTTLAEIRAKREEFEAARAKLRALLERCEEDAKKRRDDDLVTFLRALVKFFTPMVLTPSIGSLSRELVNFFEVWAEGKNAAAHLERKYGYGVRSVHTSDESFKYYITQVTARQESAWYEIAGRYMELKLKYVGG